MKPVPAVAVGAVIGAGFRYAITNAPGVDQIWSTLVINLLGCFALGIVLVHGERFLKLVPSLQPVWRPFWQPDYWVDSPRRQRLRFSQSNFCSKQTNSSF